MDSETLAWILASGLATGIGGLGLLVFSRPKPVVIDVLLGFTAGIMLAATVFSLLVPALDRGPLVEVVVGFTIGGLVLGVLDSAVPHLHARFRERGQPRATEVREAEQRGFLLLSALTIHNVPEGMAVGVAFAAGGTELGIPIALAIGIQNIPEGFAAGAPLVDAGIRRRRAALVAGMTGTVEPPAALISFAAVEIAGSLLAASLAFAAGAMLYVIVDELIPESHGSGRERLATGGLIAGFLLMMTLDNALG